MGVGWGGQKITRPFFGLKIMNLLVFFDFQPKKCFRLHGVCMGRSGTSASEVYALFQPFLLCWWFCDLGDRVLPTLSGVSGDVVTVYAY